MNVNLLVQYYNDKNSERQKELDLCFLFNLQHEQVIKIYNFKEPETVMPDFIKNHKKYFEIPIEKRLKYSDCFEYANKNLKNEICMIINADIFLSKLPTINFETNKVVGCISRWEYAPNQKLRKDPNFGKYFYCHTQDAWIFPSPCFVENCNFSLGKMGCDNAISDRIKKSGYIPLNLNNEIIIGHYDLARKKTSSNYISVHETNSEIDTTETLLVPSYSTVLNNKLEVMKMLGVPDTLFYNFITDYMNKVWRINNLKETNHLNLR